MKKALSITALSLAIALAFTSCKEPTPSPEPTAGTAYVLNEGLWGHNNASLSLLDPEGGSIVNNYFAQQNGRGLGDVAQDVLLYGSKLYITVSESHTIEILDARTGEQINQIGLGSTSPRYLASASGSVYVTTYDKHVCRIDTTSLTITGRCALPDALQPEGLAATGGKLFVCSSWESDANYNYTFDNRLFVIDLSSFTMEGTFEVSENPQRIMALPDGRLILSCGNDYNQPITTQVFNPATGQTTDLGVKASGFDVYQNNIYLYYSYTDYPAPDYQPVTSYHFKRVDLSSLSVSDLTLSGVSFVAPYGISINPLTGDILITDSQNFQANGDVHCFSSSGVHKWSAEAQSGPSKVVFLQ